MIFITILIIFVIIISILAVTGTFDVSSIQPYKNHVKSHLNNDTNHSSQKQIKPYVREKLYFYVKGIWAENERLDTFYSLSFEDLLHLELQPHNPYDKNALAVITTQGKMIGYIQRNRRKLIRTIKTNPNNIAFIHEKEVFFSNKRQKQIYRLGIMIWVGYDKEDLEKEKENFERRNFYRQEKEKIKLKLKDIDSNYKILKQSNPEMLLNDLLQIIPKIISLNENLKIFTDEKEIKPPLEKLTVMANYLEKFELTIEVFDKYYSEQYFTKNQFEKLSMRIEQAKINFKGKKS